MKTRTHKTAKTRLKQGRTQMFNNNKKILNLCITHARVKGMAADRLEILKAKCEQEIRDAEENLRVLKAKLANLIALAQESEKLANPDSEPDKYNDSGLTEAVFDAIKALWDARKIVASTTEIKNYLLAHGFQAGENFDTAIYTVLARLCESGKVIFREKFSIAVKDVNGNKVRIPPRKYYRPA